MAYGRYRRKRFIRKPRYFTRKRYIRSKPRYNVGRKKFSLARRKSTGVWTASKVAAVLSRSKNLKNIIETSKLQQEVDFWKDKANSNK